MPQTVPKRPRKGAVAPMEASSTWPNCRRPAPRAARRAGGGSGGTRVASGFERGAASSAVAASTRGWSRPSRSKPAERCGPFQIGRLPEGGHARARLARARRSSQLRQDQRPGADRHQPAAARDAQRRDGIGLAQKSLKPHPIMRPAGLPAGSRAAVVHAVKPWRLLHEEAQHAPPALASAAAGCPGRRWPGWWPCG